MIAIIRLYEESFECDTITYYVKKDKNFDEKIAELETLLKTYNNFQEIEDFMFDNFTTVELDEYEFKY